MTLTTDYTYQFGDSGVILNDSPIPSNPFVDISNVSGLDNSEYRTAERVREGSDGGFLDSQYENTRAITLDGTIYCPNELVESYCDSLKLNFAPTFYNMPFYFKHPTIPQRTIFCKSLGCRYDIDNLRRVGRTSVQFQLKAEDPSIYGDEITVMGGMAVAGTGRSYNKSYNYGYGAPVGSAGSLSAFNAGNKPATAIIRLQGVVNPQVVNDDLSKRLMFNIAVNAPDYLDIDLRNRTVILSGTANRRASMIGTSQWFLLQPGINSLRFLGTAGVGTPSMAVIYRPAWR